MLTNRCLTLVVALWSGLFLSSRAAEPVRAGVSPGDAGSDLYAYYTALDYTIPLSEIRMNVPFSNEEQVRAWRKAAENPTSRDAPRPENPVMKVGAACPNFCGMFKGSIEAVGIYNRKLGSDEVSRLAAGEVVKPALVAHYPFNQNMEDSGGGKPAMPHGGAGFSSGRREGSQALQLDGRSMWVQLPVETPLDGFTWSAWIKMTGNGAILSHCSKTGVWHALGRCLFIKNGKLSFDVGWVGCVESSVVIADGTWHHVAVAGGMGIGEVCLYVDGKRSQRDPPITEKIHELISMKPGGKVVREIKVGTPRLDDFQDPANVTRQELQLTETGIEEQSLSKARLSGTPGRAVAGSAVIRGVPGAPAAWLRFDEGLQPRAESEKYTTRDSVGGAACTISGPTALWKPGVSGTALGVDGYFSKVTLPRDKAPKITGELTLEAWVVLGAYPWNDAGIVHQSAGEAITPQAYKHGYHDPYVYPQIDVGYVFASPTSWVDEYYTIYPDGVGVREVSTTGYHDTQF